MADWLRLGHAADNVRCGVIVNEAPPAHTMINFLRLRHFKNFADETIKLGPLTIIVGTNASGKSNIRDAFRFVHGIARGYALAEIIGEKYVEGGTLQWKGVRGGLKEVVEHTFNEFTIETKATLHNETERSGWRGRPNWSATHKITVNVADSHSGPRVVKERFTTSWPSSFDSHPDDDPPAQEEPEYIFVRLPRDKQNRKHGKRLRFLSTAPVLSQLAKRKDVINRYRKPADAFMNSLQSMRFLDLSPDIMRVPSYPGQTVLGDRGENLSSVLQAICAESSLKSALLEWVRELTPIDVEDFDFSSDQIGRILVSLVETSGNKTSAYSASDGTLRFLAIAAALMGPDSADFYFFEEIDNGIHPTRVALLLQLIEQHTRNGSVQVVATSHSPQLLAMLSETAREHAVLIYRQEHEAVGHIQRIMDIPTVREVLETQNLSRLHESGWFENVMAFSHGGIDR